MTATLSSQALQELDHIEYDDVGRFLDGNITVDPRSDAIAVLTFYTLTALPVGKHTGKLNFYLCKDENCRETSNATPVALPYEVTVNAAPPAAVVTPSTISATLESAEPLEVVLDAQIATGVYAAGFAASDAQGRFASNVTSSSQGGQHYSLRLQLSPIDMPGTYSGVVNLLVCSSYSCFEGNQVPGSPVAIPYTITVTPEALLQPVPTASGLPEWETHQGNAEHTGYVPVTLDWRAFASRWSWTASAGSNTNLSPITAGSGKVIVTASGYFSSASLFAINESDGTIAWQHDFGNIFAVNHPAAWGGRVFVATSGHADTHMWSFDIADGTLKFRTSFESQWEHYLAPTVKGGYVYTNGGTYGGMYAFKGASGSRRWFAPLQQYDLWTPAVDDTYAYAYTGYEFAAVDRRTGQRAFTVANSSFNWWGYSLNIAPVLPGNGSVVLVDGIFNFGYAHPNYLISYSIAGMSEAWRVAGQFASDPVAAMGKLYVLNATGNQLEARDQATGALLWSWTPANAGETLPIGNLVLTDNLIFLTTSAATYAVDLMSHQAVWSTPHTGDLAISSNRLLYIVSETGRIEAFSLF